jgi:L-lactate dehydrogenase complex protein LldG
VRGAPGVNVVTDNAQFGSAQLDAADGALTGCAVAVAETGTIVLDGRAPCGRRALRLVPNQHICIVLAGQIVAGVPDAVAALAEAAAGGLPGRYTGSSL